MKKSTILDIFDGIRGQRDTMKMPNVNGENKDILCDTYDKLKEKLSPELLELHQRVVDILEGNWYEEMDFYFVEGFKLGLLIGIECREG